MQESCSNKASFQHLRVLKPLFIVLSTLNWQAISNHAWVVTNCHEKKYCKGLCHCVCKVWPPSNEGALMFNLKMLVALVWWKNGSQLTLCKICWVGTFMKVKRCRSCRRCQVRARVRIRLGWTDIEFRHWLSCFRHWFSIPYVDIPPVNLYLISEKSIWKNQV